MSKLSPFQLSSPLAQSTRVFVTGATGFVGGRLSERLCHEHQAHVVGLVRNWTKAVWISRYPCELIAGDMLDAEALDQAMRGCEYVFHCASGGSTDEEYLNTNINGTRLLLEACVKHRVKRLIYVSSIAVHGPSPPPNANETDDYRSYGRGYSESKIAAEKLVLEAGAKGQLEVTIVRPTFVWGPRSSLFTARPLREMRQGIFRLVNDGAGDCHAVYIEHLIDAILLAAVRPGAVNRAFLVTDAFGINWREFFSVYAKWLGIASLPSINASSKVTQYRCRTYQQLQKRLELWKSNPAPLYRKVARRTARVIANQIAKHGVMNEWDLMKFARQGGIDTTAAETLLGFERRYTFSQAMSETELWVRDQMGFELGINAGVKPLGAL